MDIVPSADGVAGEVIADFSEVGSKQGVELLFFDPGHEVFVGFDPGGNTSASDHRNVRSSPNSPFAA